MSAGTPGGYQPDDQQRAADRELVRLADEVVQHRDGEDRAARAQQAEAEADRESAEQGEQQGWRPRFRYPVQDGSPRPAPEGTAGEPGAQ